MSLSKKNSALFLFILFVFCLNAQVKENVDLNTKKTATEGFIENKGQIVDLEYQPNPTVLYLLNTPGLNIHLRQTGFSYDVYTISEKPALAKTLSETTQGKLEAPDKDITWHFHRVDIELVGCNPNAIIEGKGKSYDYLNYYTAGTPKQGVTNVHTYSEVYYHNIYNKIDLQFLVKDGKPKYNFILHPGAKLEDIKLLFNGADKTELTTGNDIKIITQQGEILERLPLSFYKETGVEISLKPRQISQNLFCITGEYINTKTIVIDPIPTLIWNTYYDGTGGSTTIKDIASDSDANILFTGSTDASSNIASFGHQTTYGGNIDGFLTKFDSIGKRIWGTYYGGFSYDNSSGVFIEKGNNIYICGETESNTNIAYNGFQTSYQGSGDAYLAKFDSSGRRLWGTYYGGSNADAANKVCADNYGNIYIAGTTNSTSGVTFSGHQNSIGGGYDAFIVKFDSAGRRKWSSYYGGSASDFANDINTDSLGSIYVCGQTSSTNNIYFNGHQSSTGPGYLVKFDSTGSRVWGTYFPGTGISVVTDKAQNVYLSGGTGSSSGVAFKAYQDSLKGGGDGFIVKFSGQGTRLWATYFGGSGGYGVEQINKLAVNSKNNIYFTGYFSSPSGLLTSGHQTKFGGDTWDAFLGSFDSSGNYLWGTYYGGSKDDISTSLSIDKTDKVYISGYTSSKDIYNPSYPQYTPYQTTGGSFIAKFTETFATFSKLKPKYCKNDSLIINYAVLGNAFEQFNKNNRFYIEISDTNGIIDPQFAQSINAFSDSAASGVIKFKLQSGISKYSNKYRLRLRSNYPPGAWEIPDTFAYYHTTPVADFFGGANPACLSDHLFRATNTSTIYGPTHQLWEFGNGDTSTSTAKNISYNGYTSAGNYLVKLTLKDTFGCSSSRTQLIAIGDNPIASFFVDTSYKCSRDTFKFRDLSQPVSGKISQRTWKFGDGSNASDSLTKNVYTKSGTYTVTLIAKNSFGCVDSTKKTITILPKPFAVFEIDELEPVGSPICFNDHKLHFTNKSTIDSPSTMSYVWYFGDGDTSTQINPVKIYSTKATYKPRLIVKSNQHNCADSFNSFYNVVFKSIPIANFNINSPVQQCQKQTGTSYSFVNTSSITQSPWFNAEWTVSTQKFTTQDLTLLITGNGAVPVKLKMTDQLNNCWDTITKYIRILPLPTTSAISGPTTSKGKKQETYSVTATTGSIYTWAINGGVIVSGQGTNQVIVRWNENSGATGQVSVVEKDKEGCSGVQVSKAVNLSPSAINGIENVNNIQLYPNPANGELNINIGQYTREYSITVFNNLGQIVLNKLNLTDNNVLNLNEFSNGVYFVRVEGDSFSFTEKVILQKM